MSFELIKNELAKNYKGEQSSNETEEALINNVPPEKLAEFIVDAFNRGWISPFNLGLDSDGDVI